MLFLEIFYLFFMNWIASSFVFPNAYSFDIGQLLILYFKWHQPFKELSLLLHFWYKMFSWSRTLQPTWAVILSSLGTCHVLALYPGQAFGHSQTVSSSLTWEWPPLKAWLEGFEGTKAECSGEMVLGKGEALLGCGVGLCPHGRGSEENRGVYVGGVLRGQRLSAVVRWCPEVWGLAWELGVCLAGPLHLLHLVFAAFWEGIWAMPPAA